MKLFGAFVPARNYFANLFDTKNGVAAVAPLKFLNEVAAQIPLNYVWGTSSGKLQGSAGQSTETFDIPKTGIYVVASIGETVTNAFIASDRRVDIADLRLQGNFFSIDMVKVTVGIGAAAYDGGDLNLYVGNSLVSTIPAATLTALLPNTNTVMNVRLSNIITLGTGTFSTTTGAEDMIYNTVLNVRSTAPTTAFIGIINYQIATSAYRTNYNCPNNLCDTCTKGTAGIRCPQNSKGEATGNCEICSDSSYTAADVYV